MMNDLERTLMTIQCHDCNDIQKVADAGRILEFNGCKIQVMHNGLKMLAGGYFGEWMSHVIRSLRGHHEPQEELIFHSILRACRHNSRIVELGSYWAYYSLWYLTEIPGSFSFCIEPDPERLLVGKTNAILNNLQERSVFFQASIGLEERSQAEFILERNLTKIKLPQVNFGSVLGLLENEFIELLHVDIQGAEVALLESIGQEYKKKVRFMFISTHHKVITGDESTHERCLEMIKSMGGYVLCEHTIEESFSGDGLIVCSFMSEDKMVSIPEISINRTRNSLFFT